MFEKQISIDRMLQLNQLTATAFDEDKRSFWWRGLFARHKPGKALASKVKKFF
jgi:hypothetical protein